MQSAHLLVFQYRAHFSSWADRRSFTDIQMGQNRVKLAGDDLFTILAFQDDPEWLEGLKRKRVKLVKVTSLIRLTSFETLAIQQMQQNG